MENTIRMAVQFVKNESCVKSIDEVKEADAIYYIKRNKQYLGNYLQREFEQGKVEFRLVVNADGSFYIHPLGKDGETFDGKF